MLANPTIFELTNLAKEEKESTVWEKAQKVKKSEFALKYAIQETSWTVPRYIAEGLNWLAADKPAGTIIDTSSFASNPDTELENGG